MTEINELKPCNNLTTWVQPLSGQYRPCTDFFRGGGGEPYFAALSFSVTPLPYFYKIILDSIFLNKYCSFITLNHCINRFKVKSWVFTSQGV